MGETLSLQFHACEDGSYEVRVKESWSGQKVSGVFIPPYSTRQLNALQKKLNSLESSDEELREIGYYLFSALCNAYPLGKTTSDSSTQTVQTVLHSVIQRTLKRRGTVALMLIFDPGCEEFVRYPWELLYNGNHFLLVSGIFTLTRALLRPDSPVGCELPVRPPFRVLYISSSPSDLAPLETERSFEALEQAFAPLIDSGQIFLDRLEPPTYSQLVRYLNSYGGVGMLDDSDTTLPCYVIHYDGHGVYGRLCPEENCQIVNSADARKCRACGVGLQRVRPQTYLCLCDEDGRNSYIDTQSLRGLLVSSDVRLAVFSACETATLGHDAENSSTSCALPATSSQAVSAIDSSLATALVTAQVPAVVAMPFSLQDDLSPTFMYHFYEAIAEGRTLEEALSRARQGMLRLQQQKSWFIPVLYRHVAEGEESPVPLLVTSDDDDDNEHPLAHLAPPTNFIGRKQELQTLDMLLTKAADSQPAPDMHTRGRSRQGGFHIALTGSPGIGKSALALEAVRRNKGKFLGGILGISLQHAKTFNDALAEIITQLQMPARNLATLDVKQRARLALGTLRSLASRELLCLLLLDGFEEVKDRAELETWLQFLANLPSEVVVMVTSRSNPESMMVVEGAHCRWYEYRVGKMTNEDLLTLFTDLAETSGLDQRIQLNEPRQQEILREICTLLDGYPLGAELIFGTARSIDGHVYTPEAATRSLEEVRDELYNTPLAGILAVLEVSYSRISLPARSLLAHLATFRLPFNREQIAMLVLQSQSTLAVAGELGPADQGQLDAIREGDVIDPALLAIYWRAARDELVQASLVQFDGHSYSIHPQIRHFALSHLPLSERHRVHRVVAAYYYNLPEPTADEWFEAFEHLESAGETQDFQEAIQVALKAAQALDGTGPLPQLLAILRRARGYATRLGDDANSSLLQIRLGALFRLIGQYTEAEACLRNSLALEMQQSESKQEGWIQYELALLYCDQGDYQQAVAYIQQILSLHTSVGEERGRALVEVAFANISIGLARYQQALHHVEQALLNCYQRQDQIGRAQALCTRGAIYEIQGQYSRATRDYEEAHRLFHDVKRIIDQAWVMVHKCSIYIRQGKLDLAEKISQEVLPYFEQEQLIPAQARVLRLRADICARNGELANARSYYEEAFTLSNQLGNYVELAAIYNALGELSLTEEDYLEAKENYEQAASIAGEYGVRYIYGQALLGLGNVACVLRHFADAEHHYHESEVLFEEINALFERNAVLKQMGMLYLEQQKYYEARNAWEKALTPEYALPQAQRQEVQEKLRALITVHRLEEELPVPRECGDSI